MPACQRVYQKLTEYSTTNKLEYAVNKYSISASVTAEDADHIHARPQRGAMGTSPLQDITVFELRATEIPLVMKGGVVKRNHMH